MVLLSKVLFDFSTVGVIILSSDNVIAVKSKNFAVRIIKLYKILCSEKREFALSKQILRSGTSIGVNVREAIQAQSKNDFISKMSIALKEAAETEYWLELLFETEYMTKDEFTSFEKDCGELNKILTAIIKSSKS